MIYYFYVMFDYLFIYVCIEYISFNSITVRKGGVYTEQKGQSRT